MIRLAIPSIELQKAVYQALNNGEYPVYEILPTDTAMPYITIGDEILTEDNTKTTKRTVHNITINTWSKGFDSTASKQMNHMVMSAILNLTIVSGFLVDIITLELLETLQEQQNDGSAIWHGVLQFEVTLSH